MDWYMKINTLLPGFWRTRGKDMYDMSELNFFFLWYAGHKLIQRGFFRRHLDLGSMVLFLMYKQRKYLKTGV